MTSTTDPELTPSPGQGDDVADEEAPAQHDLTPPEVRPW
jgi:hypothetical protein